MIPLHGFAPSLVHEMLRRQPLSPGKVTLAWQIAVGAQIARATDVQIEEVRARSSTRHVLRVRARDARWATELERARTTLIDRLKPLLGIETLTIEIVSSPTLKCDKL
jgi:predicted nucleic acid-binding Zn ribbon protein